MCVHLKTGKRSIYFLIFIMIKEFGKALCTLVFMPLFVCKVWKNVIKERIKKCIYVFNYY